MTPLSLMMLFLLWMCCTTPKASARAACEDPPAIDFGEVVGGYKPEYEENDSVQYMCDPGYTLSGSERVTCREKVWTPAPPQCLAPCIIRKQQLEAKKLLLSNGRIRSLLIPSGQKMEFMCMTGYQLTNSSTVKCGDGHMDFPSCVSDMTCEPPPEIAGGKVQGVKKSKYMPGERAQYQCWQGFQMTGDSTVACENGTWTKRPKCTGKGEKCGPPPVIENGELLSFPLQEYASGSTVEYKCPNLYVLKGSPTIRCVGGQWTNPPVCLVACTAAEEDMNRNNIELRWIARSKLYAESGDFIEFECKIGYEQDPASSPFRVQCVQGTLDYPHCKPGKTCMVRESDMEQNNIQLASSQSQHSTFLAGEYIYFECRWWHAKTSRDEEFKVQCLDGVVKYPRCHSRPKGQCGELHGRKPHFSAWTNTQLRVPPGHLSGHLKEKKVMDSSRSGLRNGPASTGLPQQALRDQPAWSNDRTFGKKVMDSSRSGLRNGPASKGLPQQVLRDQPAC
ncbi:PREDICTED: complement factor H-related protein 1-like [Tinamus guttatus]|uniref:complement factor H-related protein 1-like n=1 Tax=Tinamus guttatus TaxID=94827 RepID=UPI00052EF3B1|nr:PREDICTED: complement factor H-related protein 1-like [Tinamus guttatus]